MIIYDAGFRIEGSVEECRAYVVAYGELERGAPNVPKSMLNPNVETSKTKKEILLDYVRKTKERSPAKVSRELGISYSYASKQIQKLQADGEYA
jgi:predicted HTH transcriptional regulator